MTAALSDGDLFECRVARLLTWEGAYVRRRVDLSSYFHPERMQITDLDLLSYSFGADLGMTRLIGECKSGDSRGGPKEIDQMLRLVGLRQVTSASRAMLATVRSASERVRSVGRDLRVVVADTNDIRRREAKVGIDADSLWGSHHPDLVALEGELAKIAKRDRELERCYWLVKSEVWFLEPVLAAKRAMTAIETLSRRWVDGLPEKDRDCLAWLLGDAIGALAIASLRVASDSIVYPPNQFRRQTLERLAEGLASYSQLDRLSRAVDKYVLSILEQEGVARSKQLAALGAFAPTPPQYSEPFLEVLERFAESSKHSRFVPQVLDVAISDVVRRKSGTGWDFRRIQIDDSEATMVAARVLLRFLGGQAGLPPTFVDVLQGPVDSGPRGEAGTLPSVAQAQNVGAPPPAAEEVALPVTLPKASPRRTASPRREKKNQ